MQQLLPCPLFRSLKEGSPAAARQSLGLEAGPTNPGLDTELDVENYLNETAYAALMGYRVDGPTRY